MAPSQRVTLIIKNPAHPDGFVLEDVPLDTSLAQLQRLITDKYPGNPPPAQQTLIYAGKVLKDANVTIQQLVKPLETDGNEAVAHNFHLVIKQLVGSTSSSPPANPPTSTPAPPAAQSRPVSTSTPAPTPTPDPAAAAGPAQPTTATPGSTSAAQAAAGVGIGAATIPQPLGVLHFNPVVATAYQAAYTAALAAGRTVQQQQQAAAQAATSTDTASGASSSTTTTPLPTQAPIAAGQAAAAAALRPIPGMPMQSIASMQAYLATLQAMTLMHTRYAFQANALHAEQQLQQHLLSAGLWLPYHPSHAEQLHPLRTMLVPQGVPATLTLNAAGEITNVVLGEPAPHGTTGVRGRRGPAVVLGGVPGAHRPPARPRRQRVFTLRISMRALLQILVFAMLMYQHFTWRRFLVVAIVGMALWVASLAPLRRYVASLVTPPPPPPAPVPPAPAQPAGEGNAAAGGAAGGGDAAAGAAAPAPPPPQPGAAAAEQRPATQHRPRGIVGEIVVLLVGFITSLLPAWNINPEDAAAFAAAQAMEAREQQQAAAQARGAGAEQPQPGEQEAQPDQQEAAAGGDHPHQD